MTTKKLPNYSRAKIYKIISNQTDDIYIGSTTNFKQRKSGHKGKCNNLNSPKYNCNVYKFIRENGGWENWDMVLVEYYSCETKLELEKKEREIIEKLKPTLNKNIPTRTDKEYREDSKEKKAKQSKKYREENKEKISKRKKIWCEENKEKIKIYREERKEEIREKKKEKMTCECGAIIRKNDIGKHLKTIKHKNYINLLE